MQRPPPRGLPSAGGFGESKAAADLYQALGKEPILPEDINFATLNGVLFMARKNDLAFTVKKKVLVISEHQSTVNQNMPLRSAIYYGRTMEKLVEPRALYKTGLISLPSPKFYVFYNGKSPYPQENILKLSTAYLDKEANPMLELKVKVININPSAKHPILNTCQPLYEYSWFIQKIRDCMDEGKTRDEAIIQGMKDCIEQGFLVDFFREYGSEASNMLFTEFNMEDALEVRGEERFAEGALLSEKRYSQLILKLLEEGKSDRIGKAASDPAVLKQLYLEYHL